MEAHILKNGQRELYNLQTDLSEKNNVAEGKPEVVERLTTLMKKYITEGRSTVGVAQKNEVEMSVEKSGISTKKKGKKAGKKSKGEVALALDPQFD